MQEIAVAAILLALSAVLIGTVFAICRLLGVWKFGGKTQLSEEKTVLTKSDQIHQRYSLTTQDESNTAVSGTMVTAQYNMSLEESGRGGDEEEEEMKEPAQPTDTEQTLKEESPVSGDSISVASDYEGGPALQRALSSESIDSTCSVMELEPEPPKIGQLEFGLEYDREVGELVVSVIQARDLEANDVTGTLDSYVKFWITPSRLPKSQTKIQKNTIHPVFKERFLFNLEPEDLEQKNINFQVFSCDKYARQKLLGETDLKLGDIDLRQAIRIWMNLRDMDQRPTELGDIMFSLSYLPTAERLTAVVVKCRSLKWSNGRDAGDCFVKLYLLQHGKKVGKKKTSTKKDQRNPIFNEAMIFSVPATSLSHIELRLSVVEKLSDGRLNSFGHVIVGPRVTSGTELTHWNQMMSSLRRPVAMWHPLIK